MYARPAIGQLPMAARGLGTVDLAPRALTRAQEKADNLRRIQQIFSSTGVLGGVWTCDADYVRQDSTGQTAAAVGAPMGLVFDQSRGMVLGSEILDDTGFNNSSSWYKDSGITVASGYANLSNAGSGSGIGQNKTLKAKKLYVLSYEIVSISSGTLSKWGDSVGAFGPVRSTAGIYFEQISFASDITAIQLMSSTNGTTAVVDNFSIRELIGNHALQSTTANKPTLKRWPNSDIYWAMTETDTTALTVTFPSSLGSSCYKAVAGVNGIKEYFNQTIGTTANLVDGPLFATVILNRAPTPYERNAILAYLRFYVPGAQPSLASVQAIYAQGAVGGVWLPIDGNLFATNDTSTPASVGGKIGYIADAGGLGNHAVNATDSSRPILSRAPESRVLFIAVPPLVQKLEVTFPSTVGATSTLFEVMPTGVKKRVVSADTYINLLTQYRYFGGMALVGRATTDVEDAAFVAVMDQFVPRLGASAVPNGLFQNTTGWNAYSSSTIVAVNNSLRITRGTTTGAQAVGCPLSGLSLGTAYMLTAEVSYNSNGIAFVPQLYATTVIEPPASLAAGTKFCVGFPQMTNPTIYLLLKDKNAGDYIDIKEVLLRPIL